MRLGCLDFPCGNESHKSFKWESDMICYGQRTDCSKVACRIVENPGGRYQDLHQSSGGVGEERVGF